MSDEFDVDYDTEGNCRCGNAADNPHPCPKRVELLMDAEFVCLCCRDCTLVCGMDI